MPEKSRVESIFLSYRHSDAADFVAKVSHCLRRQARVEPYFHPDQRQAGKFDEHIAAAIDKSHAFVLFVSKETPLSDWQDTELNRWLSGSKENSSRTVVVLLEGAVMPAAMRQRLSHNEQIRIPAPKGEHVECSREIIRLLKLGLAPFDDLPISLDASYEKDIVKLYAEGANALDLKLLEKGYPGEWPLVQRRSRDSLVANPLQGGGAFRDDEAAIFVDARRGRAELGPKSRLPLTLPEAGPRAHVLSPKGPLRVAILVSGGIAPGTNSVLSAIIERHRNYEKAFLKGSPNHWVKIFACVEGFKALCRSGGGRIVHIQPDQEAQIHRWANRGGTLVPTARADELLSEDPEDRARLFDTIVDTLQKETERIDILYVIGGEGSMRAAHAIHTVYKQRYPSGELVVMGIPKTMDNDVLWAWQSFGFVSAVEKARQDIIQLHTEASSNPRVGVIQLFGSASGFVVSHAALGSNVCNLALIPEMEFRMGDVCAYMEECLSKRRKAALGGALLSPFALIVMAETAIPQDWAEYLNESYVGLIDDEKDAVRSFMTRGGRVIGQTPDRLRSAALKLVSRVLEQYIQRKMGESDRDWQGFRVFTSEPRHLIRSMDPSVTDVAYGMRLGTMAVDMAMAGYRDCMVSQWLTEYVVVPLKLVVLGRKRVPRTRIFWRTVVAKTGQMTDAYPSLT